MTSGNPIRGECISDVDRSLQTNRALHLCFSHLLIKYVVTKLYL